MDFASILDSLRYPIWQAPTSSLAGPVLATAVCKAGGMGSMAMTWTEPDAAAEQIREVRGQTTNPFFVNFALAFPPDSLEASLESGAPIVTFSWGDPEPYLEKVLAAGARLGIQVTNVAGAYRAIAQGADFLICQGNEAGGHVQSNTPLYDLLPRIVDAADGLPVMAAGGISTGKQIAKLLALGAKGMILGTRFLATKESRAHPDYKRMLVETTGETALTMCFDRGWASPHRVLRNSTLEAWEAAGSPVAGERPGEDDEIAVFADGEPVLRYGSAAPNVDYTGNIEAMCLYSGTGSSEIHDIPSVGELMERLWRECAEELPMVTRQLRLVEWKGPERSFGECIRRWKRLVEDVRRGYDECSAEYDNDVDIRGIIERKLAELGPSISTRLLSELAEADREFLALTRECKRPPRRAQGWWKNRVPLHPGPELARDLSYYDE